jgi:iron complex transport system substrate-binding protein
VDNTTTDAANEATSAAASDNNETSAASDSTETTTAVSDNAETTPEETTETEAPAADTVVSYPVTVTDQLGREVTIEEEPQTLVSGYYISTSLLLALGCEDELVGIEAKAKSRAIYSLSAPEIIDLPSVGSAKEFDLEGCASLTPDLVIVPAKLKDTIPAMEELGLTVIAVNPEDQELLEEATLLLGTATNHLEEANALLSFTDEQLNALEETLSGVDTPSVYLASSSALLSTAGPAMYQNTLIENAGGVNAAAEITDNYWAEISYEQLIAWNPDYIILAADAEYSVEDVLADEAIADCTAVKEGHVYQMPNAIEAIDSPVPGAVLGSLYLASVLHPDEYSTDDWNAAATTFYETFYGFTPDTENIYIVSE